MVVFVGEKWIQFSASVLSIKPIFWLWWVPCPHAVQKIVYTCFYLTITEQKWPLPSFTIIDAEPQSAWIPDFLIKAKLPTLLHAIHFQYLDVPWVECVTLVNPASLIWLLCSWCFLSEKSVLYNYCKSHQGLKGWIRYKPIRQKKLYFIFL